MKDYASMSDFEINRSVAIANGFPPDDCEIAKIGSSLVGVEWDDDTGYATKVFDFCNNPEDAWPIIVENKITIDAPFPQNQYWTAEKHDVDGGLLNFHVSTNPLRCAMIVFLMMKEGE